MTRVQGGGGSGRGRGEELTLGVGIVGLVVAFRVACAVLMQTSFVPDEYWQANEVAHWMAFGYGYRTWEWQHALRGYLHPGIFALLFKLLQVLHLDCPEAVATVPRVFQALLVAGADVCVSKLSAKWFGKAAARTTLLASICSWFIAYCGPRTLSSSMEAALVPIALHLMTRGRRVVADTPLALCGWSLAALACLVRPTAAVLWLPVGAVHLMQTRHWLRTAMRLVPIAALAAAVSILMDRWWYGHWTIVQLNFLRFNVLTGGASYYGTHPWWWYWVQGLPVVLGPLYIVLLLGVLGMGLRRALLRPLWPLVTASIYVAVFSMLAHKEFRFVFPVIYLVLPHVGFLLSRWMDKYRIAVAIALLINVPVMWYTMRVHQAGPEAVMRFLRQQDIPLASEHADPAILFLTNCHPTPYYSHLHRNVSMHFAACPPPPVGKSESDRLHADPEGWLAAFTGNTTQLPRFVVAYAEVLGARAALWLQEHAYTQAQCFAHAHLPQSDRDGHTLCVYRRQEG